VMAIIRKDVQLPESFGMLTAEHVAKLAEGKQPAPPVPLSVSGSEEVSSPA
jgi:hypothetical protein